MPPVVGVIAAIAGAFGAGAATATAIGIQVTIGLATSAASYAIGGIVRALSKKPVGNSLDSSSTRNLTVRQAAGPRRVIYGFGRYGGVITYANTRGPKNDTVDLVVTLTGHEVEEIGSMMFDGVGIPVDGNGDGTGAWKNYTTRQKNLGSDSQAAFPGLVDSAPGIWTTDHRQRGCAGVFLWVNTSNDSLTPGGRIPNVTFEVYGKKVYDPRSATTVYSTNPSLITADFLCNSRFGLGANYATEIDEDALIAAANICDEDVEIDGSSPPATEKRYTFNGMFDFDADPGEILSQMAGAMGGASIVNIGGKWAIYPAAYRLPVRELTDDDFVAPMKFEFKRSSKDLFNGVKGTFISPDHEFQQTDFPAVVNAAYLSEDGGVQRFKDLSYPFTNSPTECQRLAKIELERIRRQITGEVICKLGAYELIPGDTVELTHARFGWTQKTFEVAETKLTAIEDDAGGQALAVALTLREVDIDVYGFAVDDYGNLIDTDLLDSFNRKTPYGWSPAFIAGQPSTAATLFPVQDWGFGLVQEYETAADGTVVSRLVIAGKIPPNTLSEVIHRPRTRNLVATTSSTGGFLKGGRTYYIAVCGQDTLGGSPPSEPIGRYTSLSEIATIDVPAGTNTNTVTIHDLRWDASNQGWVLYFGEDPHRLSRQVEYAGSLSGAVVITGPDVQPTSITYKGFNSAGSFPDGFYNHYIGAPDHLADHVMIRVRHVLSSGDVAGRVVSVPDSTHVTLVPVAPFTTNVFVGHYASLLAINDPAIPLAEDAGMMRKDLLIASNTADGTLEFSAGQANFEVDDLIVIRTKATAVGSDAGGNYIEDTGYTQDPGAIPANAVGHQIKIISSPGAGELYVVKAVSGQKFYIEGDWITTPTTDTVFIIRESRAIAEHSTSQLNAEGLNVFGKFSMEVPNIDSMLFEVTVFTVSPAGRESPESQCPYREIFLFGGAGSSAGAGVLLTLPVPGIFSTGTDWTEPVFIPAGNVVTATHAEVTAAPTGAAITIQLQIDDGAGGWDDWGDVLTIAAAATESNLFEPSGAVGAIGGRYLRANITQVGSTFAGENLTIFVEA